MSKLKKLTAFAVTFVMLFAFVLPTGAFTISPDVAGTNYEEAAYVLGALGIMVGDAETGAFRPEDTITRAEFARVSVSVLGLDDVAEASKGQSNFTDVSTDHWANGYINVATSQKLIIGNGDGSFAPEANISYQDAITILVRALGYEPAANSKGGYPNGFLIVATENGLNKNAAGAGSEAVIRGIVANLAYNALTINLMEQTGFGSDAKYEETDKTILADKLKVEKGSGQITANEYTSISGNTALNDDQIKIDSDKFFKAGNSNAKNYLGYMVTYYAKDNDDGLDKEILLVRPEKSRNKTIDIVGSNMHKVEERQVEYWKDKDNDKSPSKARIADNAVMIYNGVYVDYDHNKMFPDGEEIAGNVKLLETNGDDRYDIVFVNEVTNLVVEETVASSFKVIDKYGNTPLTLDPDDSNYKFEIKDADGGQIEFEDLKEWDVLSYTMSEDKSLIIVQVSREKVTGKVTEIEDDRYKIGEKSYQKADNYTADIKLQDEGTFYLDALGRIAAADQTASVGTDYAYLVAGNLKTGLDSVVELKVMNTKGEMKIVELNDKVKFNGKNNTEAKDVLTALTSGGKVKAQVITYEVNSANKVNALKTATDKSGESKLVIDKYNFTKNFAGNDIVYKSNSNKLGRFNLNSDTLVFDIPAGAEEDEFAVRDYTMFENDGKYNIEVFDLEEDLTAKIVLVTNSDGKTNLESPIAVVNKITKARDDNGEEIERLYVAYDNKMATFDTKELGLLVKGETGSQKALQQGDVIQFRTNSDGKIEKISVLFDVSAKDTEFTKTISEDMQIVYGKVAKKFPSSMNVTVGESDIENYALENVVVYSYDSTKTSSNVSIKTAGDIQKYDESNPSRVFVRIYKDVVKEVFIVK